MDVFCCCWSSDRAGIVYSPTCGGVPIIPIIKYLQMFPTHVGVFPPYASAIVDGRCIGRFFHGYEKEH